MRSAVTEAVAAVFNNMINPFFWNYPSYSTIGLLHVPIVTGDQMNMGVGDSLTSRPAHIDAHIVSMRPKIKVQLCLCLPNQFERCFSLVLGQVEKTRRMPKGNDQQMPFGNRVMVVSDVTQEILEDDVVKRRWTEWAWIGHGGWSRKLSPGSEASI
jgi:hypothetical protein